VGALVVLVVGYVVARLVAALVRRALEGVGADRALQSGTAGQYVNRVAPGVRPSALVAGIVFWFVLGTAVLLALAALGSALLNDAIAGVVGYLPNVVAAVLILVVALAIAGAVGGLAERLAGGTLLGRIVQTVVPTLVITIALFMALVQLRIATQIVMATYVLVLGAIALGFALAFGLGGRDVAREMLMGAYRSGQRAMPQVRAEAAAAREQAAAQAQTLRARVEDRPAPAATRVPLTPPAEETDIDTRPGSSTTPGSSAT
jgi:hypothetical protein